MLVIRRRRGEMIRIGADIELQLLWIGKSCVRLGIQAPRSVDVTIGPPSGGKPEKDSLNGRSVEMSGEV